MSAARSASSPTVRRSFAQAIAAVAKTASEARTAKLVADAVQLYSDPGVTHLCTALRSAIEGRCAKAKVAGDRNTFAELPLLRWFWLLKVGHTFDSAVASRSLWLEAFKRRCIGAVRHDSPVCRRPGITAALWPADERACERRHTGRAWCCSSALCLCRLPG